MDLVRLVKPGRWTSSGANKTRPEVKQGGDDVPRRVAVRSAPAVAAPPVAAVQQAPAVAVAPAMPSPAPAVPSAAAAPAMPSPAAAPVVLPPALAIAAGPVALVQPPPPAVVPPVQPPPSFAAAVPSAAVPTFVASYAAPPPVAGAVPAGNVAGNEWEAAKMRAIMNAQQSLLAFVEQSSGVVGTSFSSPWAGSMQPGQPTPESRLLAAELEARRHREAALEEELQRQRMHMQRVDAAERDSRRRQEAAERARAARTEMIVANERQSWIGLAAQVAAARQAAPASGLDRVDRQPQAPVVADDPAVVAFREWLADNLAFRGKPDVVDSMLDAGIDDGETLLAMPDDYLAREFKFGKGHMLKVRALRKEMGIVPEDS